MAEGRIKDSELSAIAAAIRSKNGSSTIYKPAEMAQAILDIDTGYPEPTGTVNITQNGTTNVKDYASAAVNVPNSYAAGDEGKVVSNGALVAQTARASEITQNGTYDTTLNNSVSVNVSTPNTLNLFRPTLYSRNEKPRTHSISFSTDDNWSSVLVTCSAWDSSTTLGAGITWTVPTDVCKVFCNCVLRLDCDDPRVSAVVQLNQSPWTAIAIVRGGGQGNQEAIIPDVDSNMSYIIGYTIQPGDRSPISNLRMSLSIRTT